MELFSISSYSGLAIGVGLVFFAVAFYATNYFFKKKPLAVFVSIILSIIATWNLYKNDFYGMENVLFPILLVIGVLIFLRILKPIFRSVKTSVGST